MANEREIVITDPAIIDIIRKRGLDPDLINRVRRGVTEGKYTDNVRNSYLEFGRYLKEQGKISEGIEEQARRHFPIPYTQPKPPSEETIGYYQEHPLGSQSNINLTGALGKNHELKAKKEETSPQERDPIIQQLINLSLLAEERAREPIKTSQYPPSSILRDYQRESQEGGWLDIIVDVIPEKIPGEAYLAISYHEIQQIKYKDGCKDGCFGYLSRFSLKVVFYSNEIEIVRGKRKECQFEDIKKGVTNIISLDKPKATRKEHKLIAQATKVLEAYLALSK